MATLNILKKIYAKKLVKSWIRFEVVWIFKIKDLGEIM